MTEVAVTRSAGGAALPQPGHHLSGVSREVVLPLPDRLERTDHGRTGTRQSVSRDTGSELPPEDEHAAATWRSANCREVFAEEWSLAIADAALRDDEDATELALTGKILVAFACCGTASTRRVLSISTVGQGIYNF